MQTCIWQMILCCLQSIGGSTIISDMNICWMDELIWHTIKFLQVMEGCTLRLQALLKAHKNLPWHSKPVIQTMIKRNMLVNKCKSMSIHYQN